MPRILALLAILCLLLPSASLAAELSAMVTHLVGKGSLVRGNETLPLRVGVLLKKGDTFEMAEKSALKVTFTDGSQFTMFERTRFSFEEIGRTKEGGLEASVSIVTGKIRFFVKPKPGATNKVKFRTAQSVMGVRGTSGIISSIGDRTELFVTTGTVSLAAIADATAQAIPEVTVGAGFMSANARGAAPLAPARFEADQVAVEPYAAAIPQDFAPAGQGVEDALPGAPTESEPGATPPEETKSDAAPEAAPVPGTVSEPVSPERVSVSPEGAPVSPESVPVISEGADAGPGTPSRLTVFSPEGGESQVVVNDPGLQALTAPSASPSTSDALGSPLQSGAGTQSAQQKSSDAANQAAAQAVSSVTKQVDATVDRARASAAPSGRRRINVRFKTGEP